VGLTRTRLNHSTGCTYYINKEDGEIVFREEERCEEVGGGGGGGVKKNVAK
jgi:hypothetical protein